MRFRYSFTWIMPLFKGTEDKSIVITDFDEIWINTNKGIIPISINQNWLHAGLLYTFYR